MLLGISFDIAGIIVMSVLVMSLFFRKMTKGTANKLFLSSVVTQFMATAFDIAAEVFDTVPGTPPIITLILHTGFMLFHNMQGPVHILFIVSLTDTWHSFRKSLLLRLLISVPYITLVTMLVANPFTGIIFSYQNGYEHGPLYYSIYVLSLIYFAFDFMYIMRYRGQLSTRKVWSLLSMVLLVLGAVFIHIAVPEIRSECFAIAISQLIVSVGVQRPEDFVDSYTGLFKQTAYATDMKHAFKNKKPVSIVMLNIGNYDAVSNMIGFEATMTLIDYVARHVENITKSIKCDCSCYYLDRGRYRVVYDEKDRAKAEMAAEYIINDLKSRWRFNGFDIYLTPMIVIARCPSEIESFKSLMAFGLDFHEKHHYNGKYLLATDVYNSQDFEIRNNIGRIIEQALTDKKFEVYYQPIYSTEKKKFISAEALLRLRDDKYGFISPEIIIPAAERNGAIHEVGRYVFEEVCKFISSNEFKRLGLEYIEVNLSVAQCMNSDLADDILRIMSKYDVPPKSINLEITESAILSQRVMMDNLNKLSNAGLDFSLDDYGTGYSNIMRMISIPLKIVKIDKSFVDEYSNQKVWVFIQNTVRMMKEMNMEIVVEGVEDIDALEAFSDLRCDFIQGYFFSRPINKDEFVKFITESNEHKTEDVVVS